MVVTKVKAKGLKSIMKVLMGTQITENLGKLFFIERPNLPNDVLEIVVRTKLEKHPGMR